MDLNTIAFQVLQNSAHADENVDILFNIENVTDALIENVEIEFYLSRNNWISTGDLKLGSSTIQELAGNSESGVQKANLHLPSQSDDFWLDDEDSTYFIGALISNNNAIDLGSSAAYQQFVTHDAITITELNIPDLRGEHFSVGNLTANGDVITADINFSLKNIGDGDSDNVQVDFYISNETDNIRHPITTNNHFIGSFDVEGLDSGEDTGILATSLNLPIISDEFWDGSGYYSLGMIINDNKNTHESRRLNNNSNQKEGIDYSINTIFHSSLIDLHAVDFNVRHEDISTYRTGQNIIIDYAIRNGGLGVAAQDFNLHFYVSEDQNVTAADAFIGSQRFTDDLSAGGHGRGTADLIIPDNFPDLDPNRVYYVGVLVDGDNEVIEYNEANNHNQGSFLDFDGTGGSADERHNSVPDLTNSYFDVVSGGTGPSATINVELSVANLSHVDATSPFSVGVYLSDNEYIAASNSTDVLLGTIEFPEGLTGYGDSGIINRSFTLPNEDHRFWTYKGNGTYFIGAVVDPENEHSEFLEANNSNVGYKFDSDVTPVAGLTFTDLIGSSFSAERSNPDSSLLPGDSVEIKYQIGNQEEHDAESFEVKFYVSSNPYISPNDYLLGTHRIESVDGLSSTDILNGTFHLPNIDDPDAQEFWENARNDQGDGTFYFGMIIDEAQEVNELSHSNNQNQGQFLDSDTIEVFGVSDPNEEESKADLIGVDFRIIDGVTENNTVEPGAEIEVEYSVLNAGGSDASFFANEFFVVDRDIFHTIENLSVSDVNYDTIQGLFGDEDSAFIQLESYGFSGIQDVTLRIPENISAGHYVLVMQTDVFSEVEESNEFNNIISTDISIEGPDLTNKHLSITEDFTEENPLLPGETFTAEYEIANGGTEDIPFFAAHFYIVTEEFKNRNSEIEFSDIEYNPNINSPDFDPDSDPLFTDVFPLYGDEFTEVITLGAGHSTELQSIHLEIPEEYNIAPGKYYLGIQSDVFDEVDETNELNNSLLGPTTDFVELYIGEEA